VKTFIELIDIGFHRTGRISSPLPAPSCRFLPRLTRRIETERQERQEHIANMFELEEEEAGPPRRSSRFYCSLSCVSQQRNNELFQKREESQDN
jgi:hypothetical protein